MFRFIKLILVTAFFGSAAALAQAPLETHLLVDLATKNTSAKDFSNLTFHGQSNFHPLRVRLFLEKKVSDRGEVFTQLLSDNANSPRIYGAYIRIKSNSRWANLEAGLNRTPFGTWGPRTYSDKNPLMGVPLGYGYHTAFAIYGYAVQKSPTELLANRGQGSIPGPPYGFSAGLPLVYDACWNSGLLVFGGNGKFDYMLGVLAGSLSNPSIELERSQP